MANGHYQTFLLLTILASTIQLLLESPIKSEVKGDGHLVYLFLWTYRRSLLAPRILHVDTFVSVLGEVPAVILFHFCGLGYSLS